MAGYSIRVSANTDPARNALKKLGKDLDVATKARKLVIDKSGLNDYQAAFKRAGETASRATKNVVQGQQAIQRNLERTSKL